MMVDENVGFFDRVKDTFNKPTSWYVELAGYLIAGFIIGFLIKHAGRLFFLLVLGAVLALWALDYMQLITVHYPALKSQLGLAGDTSLQDIFTMAGTWIRSHIIETLAAFFGFVIAWKFA